jgi:hypothetical protein
MTTMKETKDVVLGMEEMEAEKGFLLLTIATITTPRPPRPDEMKMECQFTMEGERTAIIPLCALLPENYGTVDLDKHVEHIDTVLDYHEVQVVAKCKLFVVTLKGPTMTWFKGLVG